jgi:hypothetical protein
VSVPLQNIERKKRRDKRRKQESRKRQMVVILVHWLIREGCEQAFKDFWRDNMSIPHGKNVLRI